jgi:hypothetical protein
MKPNFCHIHCESRREMFRNTRFGQIILVFATFFTVQFNSINPYSHKAKGHIKLSVALEYLHMSYSVCVYVNKS